MAFLLFCAVLGPVSTWSFLGQFYLQHGRPYTFVEFMTGGFQVSPLISSISADFLVGAIPAMVWMCVEARRLRMRWWLYLAICLWVAFACGFPLFLFMRERALMRSTHAAAPRSAPGTPALGG